MFQMAFLSFLPVGKDVMCESRRPLLQGEVLVFRSLLTDFTDSGDTIAMVLRENAIFRSRTTLRYWRLAPGSTAGA